MNREEALEKKEAFREKIRSRLTASDVRLFDLFSIDGDDWLATPSTNEITLSIWSDLKNMCRDFENPSAHVVVAEVLNKIGDEIIEALGESPLNDDDRFPSEIAYDELVSTAAAKTYKHIINKKMPWYLACNFKNANYDYEYVKHIYDAGIDDGLVVFEILDSVQWLCIKNMGRMKVSDILKEK